MHHLLISNTKLKSLKTANSQEELVKSQTVSKISNGWLLELPIITFNNLVIKD